MNQAQPWAFEWTPDLIIRYWDWLAKQPRTQRLYFSRMRGDAILDATRRYWQPAKSIIDLGAGPGYLTEKLLRRGANVIAIDTSPESVAALKSRLDQKPNFKGAHVSSMLRVPLADATAEAIFLIETIEHLDDQAFESLMCEARRLLKSNGALIVTTPNEEVLQDSQAMCPNCACTFHMMQHVRTWSACTLDQTMRTFGLATISCKATLFSRLPRLLRPLNRLLYLSPEYKRPHLLYVGRKV